MGKQMDKHAIATVDDSKWPHRSGYSVLMFVLICGYSIPGFSAYHDSVALPVAPGLSTVISIDSGQQQNIFSQVLRSMFNEGLEHYVQGRYQQAQQVWWPLADSGDANAQYYLGVMSGNGDLDISNSAMAASWYRLASLQGHHSAQLSLGISYANGEGVHKDMGKAIYWWRKSAMWGNVDAQYNLGLVYNHGFGVERNVFEAFKWWAMAASMGDHMAQYLLGMAYATGEGVTIDYGLAKKWWEQSARQGNSLAQSALIKLPELYSR